MFKDEIKKAKTKVKEINWGFYRISREYVGGRVLVVKDPFKWILLNRKGDLIGKVRVDANYQGEWFWTVYGTKGFDVQPEVYKTAKGAFNALVKAHKISIKRD